MLLSLFFLSLVATVKMDQTDDPTDSCPSVPLDIHFVVDTSKSIKDNQFEQLKQALADLADHFDIGPGSRQTRMAVVGFGKNAERFFDFDDHLDKASVKEALLNMGRVAQYKATRTHLGINLMLETFDGDYGSRPDAKDISIVFTDGKSTKPDLLKQSLEGMKDRDITQYAVGIGKGIDHEELLQITLGNPDHVYEVSSFDKLQEILAGLSNVGCICEPVCVRGKCNHDTEECECPPQWTGEVCDTPVCEPECVHGTCNRDFQCECEDKWEGSDCNTPVCEPACVHGTCGADHTCQCENKWEGPDCNTPVCEPACVHGTCGADHTCQCEDKWEGPDCNTPICEPACVHGTCGADHTCQCEDKWEGPDCNTPICEPACVHGTCDPDTHTCSCEDKWEGPDCNTPVCDPSCVHGTCNPTSHTCTCDEGYQGSDCSTPLPGGPKPETETASCPSVPLDIHFVVDTSKSIKDHQYEQLKQALADLADHFDIGPGSGQARIAVVGFGRNAERFFDFDDHLDKASVKEAIMNMGRVARYTATRTHLGINLMLETFDGDYGSRPDAKHISIVFTDGKSTKPQQLQQSLEGMKDRDIIQHAVGIGKGIDHEELLQIALGNPNHVHEVSSFDKLREILAGLSNVGCSCEPVCVRGNCNLETKECECPPQWTGDVCDTPVCEPECVHGTCNRDFQCECEDKWEGPDCNTPECTEQNADIVIILDASNSMDGAEFNIVKKFATGIVMGLDIGESKTRIGVIKYKKIVYLVFGLIKYFTIPAINTAIWKITRSSLIPFNWGTSTAGALNMAVNHLEAKGRSGVLKKIIVITDGRATDESKLPAAIARCENAGIKRYSIGVGSGINWEAKAELRQIAGSQDRTFVSPTFSAEALYEVLSKLTRELKCD